MDRAYEGDETCQTARDVGLKPMVPPKRNRRNPWRYNQKLYKRRNEIESFFRRIQDFRRIATRNIFSVFKLTLYRHRYFT